MTKLPITLTTPEIVTTQPVPGLAYSEKLQIGQFQIMEWNSHSYFLAFWQNSRVSDVTKKLWKKSYTASKLALLKDLLESND